MAVEISVLVDNEAYPPLKPEWGLSIKVETPQWSLLWDTGATPQTLKYNASQMGKSLDVDFLVFSHRHWDHTGGYEAVNAKEVYSPYDPYFPIKAKSNPEAYEIYDGIYATRTLEAYGIREMGLVIDIEGYGQVLLVGCSHPGVHNIYASVVKDLGLKPRIVIGGFHLFGAPKRVVESVISSLKNMGAKELHPIHCSGEYAKRLAGSNAAAGFVLRLP